MRIGVPQERGPGATGRPHPRRGRAACRRPAWRWSSSRAPGTARRSLTPDYREAGAEVADGAAVAAADVVVQVGGSTPAEVARLRPGQVVVGWVWPLVDAELVQALAAAGVTAFGMESVPRVTRAQRMDALSSQATVSGYKAVLIAADQLPRFFPMLMTAAGTVAPARCSCWAPASPACRRSRPRAGSAPSSRPSTPGRSSRSRSRAWARSSSSCH